MSTATAGSTGPLRWAAINRPLDGEPVSGDRCVVRLTEGVSWIAGIDGLGHGPEAAAAAAEAARVLETGTFASVVDALVSCHAALGRTRGAVMSIVRVSGAELSWVGVGNVETAIIRGPGAAAPRVRLLLYGGVVGHTLPTPRPSGTALRRGDLIVLATDGLSADVMDHIDTLASPQAVVDRLMTRCRTGRDDALAFAARYDGAVS